MNDVETIHHFAEQNMLVERYLLGELSGMDLEDFELHLFQCCICFEQVKAGQVFAQHICLDSAPPPRKIPWVLFIAAAGVTAGLAIVKFANAVPFLIAGGAVMAMLLSVLLRYNERFREFWATHVCAFMEEHALPHDETKGGA